MQRTPRRLRIAAFAALLPCVLATQSKVTRAPSAATTGSPFEKPNVVVLLLDDATVADLRYLADTRRDLGSHGLTFTRAVAPNPLCGPSRAHLMTGQSSRTNGVLSNGGPYGGMRAMVDKDNTIAAWVHDAGYQTALEGKYINGYGDNRFTNVFGDDGTPTGWDHWDPTTRAMTGYWHFSTFQQCPTSGDTACVDRTYAVRRYATTVEKDKTLSLIDRFHQSSAPFFIFDSWVAPHKDEHNRFSTNNFPKAPARFHLASDTTDFTRLIAAKPSYNERDMSDKTPDLSHLRRVHHARDNYLGRVAALRATDQAIDRIVRELKKDGEFDNTLLIVTSDNGFMNGEHRMLFKKWEFTESLSVPLLMSWPDGGVQVGVTDRTATVLDIPATILAATGAVSGRSSVDGVSLLDTVPTTVRRYPATPVLIGSGRNPAKLGDEPWAYEGVQWGPYTWTRHWGANGAWIGDQFYDSGRDPYQVHSRQHDPYYRKNIILTMKQYYEAMRLCAGADQCVPPARKPIVAHDPDHDGLWSYYERTHYGTDPMNPDTDGDGIRDGRDHYPLDHARH